MKYLSQLDQVNRIVNCINEGKKHIKYIQSNQISIRVDLANNKHITFGDGELRKRVIELLEKEIHDYEQDLIGMGIDVNN